MHGFNENMTILSFLAVSQMSTTHVQRTESNKKLRLEEEIVNMNMNINVNIYVHILMYS